MAVAAGGPRRHGTEQSAGDALSLGAPIYNVANALTFARLLAVLPIVLLIRADAWTAAFAVFVAAALTDVADGWVAKRFAGRSSVGAMLDPMADKLLLAGTFLALAKAGVIPVWLAVLVVGRDVVIVIGTLIVRSRIHSFRVVPLAIGKLTTFVLLVTAGLALGGQAAMADTAALVTVLIPVSAALVLASGVSYLASALRMTGTYGVRT